MSEPDIQPAAPRAGVLRTAILVEAGIGLLGWAIGIGLGRSPMDFFHWRMVDLIWGVAATVPMLAALAVCLWLPFAPMRRLTRIVREILIPMFQGAHWTQIALISALAGWGEELFFRGVVQYFSQQWLGPLGGLAVASIVFGLAHPLTRTYIVVAAVIGAYLGWLWLTFDNLLVPMVAHGLYDFVVLMWMLRTTPVDAQE
ncbi:MAG: type II CAAX endopeptidase family protein [Pirellulales bacterium]